MTNPRDFAERLQVALDRVGMSSKELARSIGMTWQGIRKYKAGGSSEMYATNLFKSAQVLRVNALWLATGEGPMLGGPTTAAFNQLLSAPALEVAMGLDAIRNPESKLVAYAEIQQVLVKHSEQPTDQAPPKPDDPPKGARLPRFEKPPGKYHGEP